MPKSHTLFCFVLLKSYKEIVLWPYFLTSSCLTCAHRKLVPMKTAQPSGIETRLPELEIFHCEHCGMLFLKPFLDIHALTWPALFPGVSQSEASCDFYYFQNDAIFCAQRLNGDIGNKILQLRVCMCVCVCVCARARVCVCVCGMCVCGNGIARQGKIY